MNNLYDVNGLMFWSETEIKLRKMFEEHIVSELQQYCLIINPAFKFIQVEAPILTPAHLLLNNYTKDEVFTVSDTKLALRTETTMGSYAYADFLLSHQQVYKPRLPLVVWQHGKSFRNEQDKTTKNMRLKEFYQLEFQILYSIITANDYTGKIKDKIQSIISNLVSQSSDDCLILKSDRLPKYSDSTFDVEVRGMEVCSMSVRNDFEGLNNFEVAIGTDRLIYQYNNRL